LAFCCAGVIIAASAVANVGARKRIADVISTVMMISVFTITVNRIRGYIKIAKT
jgi:hypothetical protein